MSDYAYVLDASALLAAMLGEPGADRVEASLATACIGAVNLSEVIAKLHDRDVPDALITDSIAALDLAVVPFDAEQAERAGRLRAATRGYGLSLGDRACLALAQTLGVPALTTDAAWREVDAGVTVEMVRD